MSARVGVTLLELMVVIAILSVLAAVSGLAMRRARPVADLDATAAIALAARDSALRTGRVVSVRVAALGSRRAAAITAYPDGRVLADAQLGIDPLSGRVPHAKR
jgi:prepilin-type N-terminal cleavage/methylation domain-containing protein